MNVCNFGNSSTGNSCGLEVCYIILDTLTLAFNPENLTQEAEGFDPSGPNMTRTNPATLLEGMPTTLPLQGVNASHFMVEIVHKYPGQVDIFVAGAMTNIALAIQLNATFAQNVKSIIIQGGYLDVNLRQVDLLLLEH